MTAVLTATPGEALRLASILGYAGFFCLAAAVLLGMARAVDRAGARLGGEGLEQLHLAAAVGGIAGVGGHIAAHMVRADGSYGVLQVLVPFARGGWIVAAGVTAWLLLVLVTLAVPFRRVLGYRGWLLTHRLAYAAALLLAVHVIAASDEVGRLAAVGIAVLGSVAWVLLGVRRRLQGSDDFTDPAAGPGPPQRALERRP